MSEEGKHTGEVLRQGKSNQGLEWVLDPVQQREGTRREAQREATAGMVRWTRSGQLRAVAEHAPLSFPVCS